MPACAGRSEASGGFSPTAGGRTERRMGFDQSNIDDLLRDAGLGSGGGKAAAPAASSQGDVDSILGTGGSATATKAKPVAFQSFDSNTPLSGQAHDIENLLGDVQLKVQIILGRSRMSVEDILQLANGSVVELDKLAGDPLDILVNDRLVAKGEVLVLNENFCIRITDIIPPSERT
jgi:flagellar motor switch protein FliN/FliY